MWCKQTHTYCNASTDTNTCTGLQPPAGECYIFYDLAHWLFIFTVLCKNTHLHTHTPTLHPEAIWQCANPTLCACSFTRCFGPLTGPWHRKPARPPWPPSSHHPSVFSFPRASNPASQAQCGFTYCHNDTSHRPTSTLREWVINKPGAICRLSVKSRTPLHYQSSARHQALLSFLPLL